MSACVLMIFAPPALEETLVDWLLENESVSGFSTMHGYGHGANTSAMSLLDQVAGRQRKVEFIVSTTEAVAQQLVAGLREKFAGSRLHYMVMPLVSEGTI
ncbi:peptidase [Novimethylophilus kurashikiensis]|uniref:Peptidase n=1 Tax=Novimethylophilus kurashikiensis TaxID=1825523 RepID=A0A2R5FB71_9PROT|nr:DUF3240 family protein [Novimethylophilus kurashikiensis]GBG15482.1 peptidase [Novimethylophilus kurashikiensis]